MLYQSLKPVARIALAWYYRSITVSGAERVPESGPVFLAVNHPNALVDALVVAATTPRRVRFTAKATIFANPLVAAFLRRAGVVPLRRASDERAAIAEANAEGIAEADAETNTGTNANVSTHADPSRNAATFEAVADALAEGAAVVIFPEGKSHDAPQLAPLRTGLARMVQMAQRERAVRGIRIVPVGLLFERKEDPRSRVLVQVGEPIDVDALGSGITVAALTDIVAARLASVTVNFGTSEDAERIGLVGETLGALLAPLRDLSDDVVPLSDTIALVHRIDRTQRRLAADGSAASAARVHEFESRLRAFRAQLATARIDVHDLGVDTNVAPAVRFAVRETVIAAALLPFVLWGRFTHFVPLRLTRGVALRGVRNRDEPAMRTLVVGLLLVLASYAIETALVSVLAGPWWALLFLVSLIPSATLDFRYGDRLHRARARARAYFRFRRDPTLRLSLLAEAEWLRQEAGALEASAHATTAAATATATATATD